MRCEGASIAPVCGLGTCWLLSDVPGSSFHSHFARPCRQEGTPVIIPPPPPPPVAIVPPPPPPEPASLCSLRNGSAQPTSSTSERNRSTCKRLQCARALALERVHRDA